MDAQQVQEIRLQAVQRVQARKRQPVERLVPVRPGMGVDHISSSVVEGSEYLPPETLGEWLDDRLAAQPWTGPFTGVLYQIAGGARVSEAAALAEIRHARQLTAWDQFHCYTTLSYWHGAARIPAARSLMSALIAAWEDRRSKLASARPEFSELPDLPSPPRPRVLEYETPFGNPAGRLAWS